MTIILPIEKHGLNAAISKLNDGDLKNVLSRPYRERVYLKMPKFSLSQKESVVESLKKVFGNISRRKIDL